MTGPSNDLVVPHDRDRMPKFPSGSLNRLALCHQVN